MEGWKERRQEGKEQRNERKLGMPLTKIERNDEWKEWRKGRGGKRIGRRKKE